LKRLATFICLFVSIVFLGHNKVYADEIKTTENNVITDWKTLTNSSIKRNGFRLEEYNGKIYVIGGYDMQSKKCLSTTEVYDPLTDKWSTLASMPTSRQKFETVVINGKIYAIGGYDADMIRLSATEVYDISSNSWTKLASMYEARDGFQCTEINGKIYVMGGFNKGLSLKGVELYDPSTNSWTKLASMNEGRNSFKVEVINGKIYAIGGDDSNKGLSSVEVYDPTTNSWTKLASMSQVRSALQTTTLDGKIYAFGGYYASNPQNTAEVYDPTTNSWTNIASMPTAMAFPNKHIINGKIYAIKFSKIDVYNPKTNTWIEDKLPKPYSSESTIEISGKIYIMDNNSMEVYTISGNSTTPGDTENPSKLIAVGGDTKVDLTWPKIKDATSYTIKRSTSAGGPYTPIASGITGTTYTDTGVTNGSTYYYMVTVIKDGSEIWNSNEASATPIAATNPVPTGKQALLVITMQNGERKEYDLTMEKINDFLTWYNNAPVTSPTYVIEKNYNKASFTSRKDYISYSQISSVEVNEYGN
jgi:N-acetylneuraminic acid mutarotase